MVFCCSSVAGGREIWSVTREAENIFMSIHSGTVFYERGKKRHKQINILFAVLIFADVDFIFPFSPALRPAAQRSHDMMGIGNGLDVIMKGHHHQ
jgi:hypothetical protein